MMEPAYHDEAARIYAGDVASVLADLPTGCVDCIITSPPYYGLRDYGIDAQIGLEATPDEHVAKLVAVFREARRVLADHGTLWLNYGDTYNARLDGSHGGWNGSSTTPQTIDERGPTNSWSGTVTKLAPKNLLGMPWRVAFALQADGWILRSDIIWAKPNPMPESVTDRPTKAHEYVFLFAKQPRYWYDADAIRQDWTGESIARRERARLTPYAPPGQTENTGLENGHAGVGRNARTVWEIATQPFPEAHFATFPEELVRRCLLAGCPAGGTVLDPFMGSGTTALVARKYRRLAVGVELNPDYIAIAAKRLSTWYKRTPKAEAPIADALTIYDELSS